ncbi:hypothetical protein PNOK_0409400 [Pyrrhoderma noxium]|uniref:Uncharacterized protein n=1 Tax=Pyrrhoderma noxium TaxID=2282107 RepID=A0A286UPE6_9AGAM|nr:hypothetical protein PNOK_0409400 [Pyrrhoderma noxium]
MRGSTVVALSIIIGFVVVSGFTQRFDSSLRCRLHGSGVRLEYAFNFSAQLDRLSIAYGLLIVIIATIKEFFYNSYVASPVSPRIVTRLEDWIDGIQGHRQKADCTSASALHSICTDPLSHTGSLLLRPNDSVSERCASETAAVPFAFSNRADHSDLALNLPYQNTPAPTLVSNLLDIPSTQDEETITQNQEVDLRRCPFPPFYKQLGLRYNQTMHWHHSRV